MQNNYFDNNQFQNYLYSNLWYLDKNLINYDNFVIVGDNI